MTDAVQEYLDTQTQRDNELGQIKTFTGLFVSPMSMTPEMINIIDIAHALSRVCRFAGHCAGFLSVAEHSIHVARLVIAHGYPQYALEALLHDASEAYLGDMPRPIKHLPEMQVYRDAEAIAERAIATKFGLVFPLPEIVKQADRERCFIEMDTRRDNSARSIMPDHAKGAFLATYDHLVTERNKAA